MTAIKHTTHFSAINCDLTLCIIAKSETGTRMKTNAEETREVSPHQLK